MIVRPDYMPFEASQEGELAEFFEVVLVGIFGVYRFTGFKMKFVSVQVNGLVFLTDQV